MAEQDARTTPDTAPSPEQLEADIERKRLELAHTLDQLGTRLDVKKQVRDRVEPQHLAVAGALVATLVVLVVWRRRR
ncbi:DUF3618 domain-containing protein [Nocardioides solisilvae]|uniref:DUF3618 domain-containing protein n=1 Tax=Nocardioides solisilvae TaxID=1542435 RepID=UPI000D747AD4|nr:DUF3618 domain-containing protein [Nocardioides solisilvae]